MKSDQEKMKKLMLLLNNAMIEHFQTIGEAEDPNIIMNVLLNLISEYCSLMGTDPVYIFQQGINAFSDESSPTSSMGGIGLEYE